ncbi:MAG TPA: nucleotide exchange factor GrpE [Clostridiales bacterium]|jgi:molecular chaperone GrpE|nr:nucleotide exchange factor GrpE [Clostridiales bacterium]HRT82716.1 nucleotide exchange factor GrpE [Oscillospiraceae bacterium]
MTKEKNEDIKKEDLMQEPPKEDVKDKKAEKAKKSKAADSDRVAELEKEVENLNDQLIRLAAEYSNFRRRSGEEKVKIYNEAKADVILELLPVIDNFELSQNSENANYEDYRKGMDMIYNQFIAVIEKLGIEYFGEIGEEFDPNVHCAVMHVEDDKYDDNVIAQVLCKGYKLKDKIIRSASVKVAN